MTEQSSIQDQFLMNLKEQQTPVFIYLTNGIKLQGQIDSFDNFSVFLKGKVTQLVYKHTISTILPAS